MAKCIVTGGAGFIGSNLVDELIGRGNEVIIIDNLLTGQRKNLNPKASFYELDIRDFEKIIPLFKNIEYVFHLAAQMDVRKSVEDPIFDNSINVAGSINIFKACVLEKIKKIIFFSTGGALYGDTNKPASEEFPIKPDSPYGVHKFAAEKNLEIFFKLHGLNYAILRPANVYGPRQYKGGEGAVIAVFTYNALNDNESVVYGDGLQTRDFIYVDDIVRACIIAMENKSVDTYNIGSGVETNIVNLINVIKSITGKEFKYKNEKERSGEAKRSVLDCSKAKKMIGWRAEINIEDGIRKTLKWIEENKI
jgi:UDP-glucose 4-epimerase